MQSTTEDPRLSKVFALGVRRLKQFDFSDTRDQPFPRFWPGGMLLRSLRKAPQALRRTHSFACQELRRPWWRLGRWFRIFSSFSKKFICEFWWLYWNRGSGLWSHVGQCLSADSAPAHTSLLLQTKKLAVRWLGDVLVWGRRFHYPYNRTPFMMQSETVMVTEYMVLRILSSYNNPFSP